MESGLLLSDMTQSAAEFVCFYDSPVGLLGICIGNESIISVDWLDQENINSPTPDQIKPSLTGSSTSQLQKKIILTLDNYFASGVMDNNISLRPQGTIFQKSVWQVLKTIPFGSTMTYGDVAKELRTSSRAVGQACRRNNIPLFIPCHRVVAANGLGGFMGGYRHVERKRWLLQHEGVL